MKHKPVKHLADCDICFVVDSNGYRVRKKAICNKCEAYPKCIASQTDGAMDRALRSFSKINL